MAISRSSALKINTPGWITFSITIALKHSSLTGTLPVPLLRHCINSLYSLACVFGLPEKSHALRQKNGNSRRAQKQGGLPLIIHRSNLTAQRPNDSISSPMLRLKKIRQKSVLMGITNPQFNDNGRLEKTDCVGCIQIRLQGFTSNINLENVKRDSSYLHCLVYQE